MNPPDPKIAILPCSGIGKTYGSVSREAAYLVTEDLRPEYTQLLALSLLVLGDEESRAFVANNPCITLDGCKLGCAGKMVQESGGSVVHSFYILDVFRRNREFKPRGISQLNQGGLDLACAVADEVVTAIDALLGSSSPNDPPAQTTASGNPEELDAESS